MLDRLGCGRDGGLGKGMLERAGFGVKVDVDVDLEESGEVCFHCSELLAHALNNYLSSQKKNCDQCP